MNLNLGKIFGIPLYIHWSWWIVLVAQAIYNLDYLGVMVAMFGIVLLHELGHCLASKYFGLQVDSITLHIMGGVAHITSDDQWWTPKKEFWVVLCGPLVNVALALPLYLLGEWSEFFARLFLLNLIMLIFNLLPAFPLDGAKIGRSILSSVTNERLATITFVYVTKTIAALLGVLALAAPLLSYNAPFLGWFMILAVIAWLEADKEYAKMPLPNVYRVPPPTEESLDILRSAREDLAKYRRKYNR
jgi:Zn-dependent protease